MSHGLYIASVSLHILAAAVWLGGMIAFVAMVLPALRHADIRPHAASLLQTTGYRLRAVGWAAFSLLLVTGVYNLAYSTGLSQLLQAAFWKTPYGEALAIKLCLFGAVLLLSAFHDFAIGPRATRAWKAGDSASLSLRRRASWIGRANLVLGLAIVAMAVILVRGWP